MLSLTNKLTFLSTTKTKNKSGDVKIMVMSINTKIKCVLF